MNKELKQFLQNTTVLQARELYDWLVATPNARQEMQEILISTHSNLAQARSGEKERTREAGSSEKA